MLANDPALKLLEWKKQKCEILGMVVSGPWHLFVHYVHEVRLSPKRLLKTAYIAATTGLCYGYLLMDDDDDDDDGV